MKNSINKFLGDPSLNSDSCFNFFDWFCDESSLEKRMLALVPKLRFLVKEGIVNSNTNYVWFKNNYLLYGGLCDDIRISSLNDDGTYLGGFNPRSGNNYTVKKCQVWLLDEDAMETIEFDNWASFKKEVKSNPVLKARLVKCFNSDGNKEV